MALKHATVFSFVCVFIHVTASDPCRNSPQLPLLPQRVVGYVLKPKEKEICDQYLMEGWYKIDKGYTLATTKNGCGTMYPWHLNGTIENITVCKDNRIDNVCDDARPVAVKKCGPYDFRFHLSRTYGCSEAYCIEAINGSQPTGQPTAAPTLSRNVMPVINAEVKRQGGKGGPNILYLYCDFTPDPGTKYYYTVGWHLSNGISFTRFLWSSPTTEYTNQNHFRRKTAFDEKKMKQVGVLHLGFKIACEIAPSYNAVGISGHPKASTAKLIGIEVVNRTLVQLHDNGEASIFLQLTVPFGCPKDRYGKTLLRCSLDVTVFMPDKKICQQNDIALKMKNNFGCGVRIYNDEVGKPTELRLQGRHLQGNIQPQGRHLVARLTTQGQYKAHKLFEKYYLEPVSIRLVTNNGHILSGKRCYAHSDPHILTFDGECNHPSVASNTIGKVQDYIGSMRARYNAVVAASGGHNRYWGFVNVDRRGQCDVQIKTDRCPNHYQNRKRPWCNCGAVVSAGRDVFMINRCNRSFWDINFKHCEDGVLKDKVFIRGKNHKILLPTGTVVEININPGWPQFLEIDILPSTYDYKATTGLCGSFDGDKTNDRQGLSEREFSKTTKPTTNESLFEETNYNNLQRWDEEEFLCICTNPPKNAVNGLLNIATCDPSKVYTCHSTAYQLSSKNTIQCSIRHKRHARDVAFDDASDTHSSLDVNYRPNVNNKEKHFVKRATVYDAVSARAGCRQELNTTVFQLCKTVPDLDTEPYIDSCAKDAVFTNSMAWAATHLEGVKNHCVHQVTINQPLPQEVLSDPSFTLDLNDTHPANATGSVNGTIAPLSITTTVNHPGMLTNQAFSSDFLDKLEAISCSNECSGNGICVNGSCLCNAGYSDPDCSIDLSQPPVMRGIPDRGLCDLTKRLCGKTSVFGENFAETTLLTCNIEPFSVNDNSSIVRLASVKRPAVRRSFAEASCSLNDSNTRSKRSPQLNNKDDYLARGYSISISNDGVNFGDADSIVVFDSTCVNCTKLGTKVICMKTSGFCMKKGHCFADGQPSGCEVCKTGSSSASEWLKGPDCLTLPIPKSESPNLWIIGAVLGTVVCIVGVAVIVVIIKRRTSKTDVHRKDQMVVEHNAGEPKPEVKPYGYQ